MELRVGEGCILRKTTTPGCHLPLSSCVFTGPTPALGAMVSQDRHVYPRLLPASHATRWVDDACQRGQLGSPPLSPGGGSPPRVPIPDPL